MSDRPVITKTTRQKAGSCNFCSRPHHTVTQIRAQGHGPKLQVRLCHQCVKDLSAVKWVPAR